MQTIGGGVCWWLSGILYNLHEASAGQFCLGMLIACHFVPVNQNCRLLCPAIPFSVDEKGLRERRENTSSRFQAFYNALGHENWNSYCLNDEMAHQRDLNWGLHDLVTKRSFPFERREGMINTLGSTQLLNFCVFPPLSLINSKWSCSRGLFRFEHELGLRVGIQKWQTHRERRGPENREVVARHQSYFCL